MITAHYNSLDRLSQSLELDTVHRRHLLLAISSNHSATAISSSAVSRQLGVGAFLMAIEVGLLAYDVFSACVDLGSCNVGLSSHISVKTDEPDYLGDELYFQAIVKVKQSLQKRKKT